MIKPIFTIGIPACQETCSLELLQKKIQKNFIDYNILVYICNGNHVKFKAFYEKDFNEVKFEELKQIVKRQLK
jgi:hypothetical protein